MSVVNISTRPEEVTFQELFVDAFDEHIIAEPAVVESRGMTRGRRQHARRLDHQIERWHFLLEMLIAPNSAFSLQSQSGLVQVRGV
jgi:hypothetical protein